MSQTHIPDQMTAVVLDSYDGVEALRIEQRPMPTPGPNEVLVKMAASPINPSDLAFLVGHYASQKPTPIIPGLEGSGTVVATGGSLMGRYLDGKRVACVSQARGEGIWAEYVVTSTNLALPLDPSVTLEQGAMSVVNPMTAIALLTIAKEGNHQAIVQTAAASALGQMISRLSQRERILVINIVRRKAQVDLLKEQGAAIVLNSSEADFDKHLQDLCHEHNVRLAFDAVAGSLTNHLLEAMPPHSKVIVYGGLSYQPIQIDPRHLIFQDKIIEGFWLTSWSAKRSFLQNLLTWRRVQRLLATDLKSEVRTHYPLQEAQRAIKEYQGHMTGGKVLLKPGREMGDRLPA